MTDEIDPAELEGMSDWDIEQLRKTLGRSLGRSPRDGSQPSNRCGEGQPQPSRLNHSYRAGDRVVFTYYHGETAEGVVTSVNERYVFVRFGNGGSESCEPSMLTLSPERP